ncbi:hypothetical protein HMPREF3113_06005 [Stenotrophomonas sp. HMSC10F06]|nr:hypothetical protein HMPREF3113_06005 [Stenotrophomonas sp. HMSC10F06]
MIECVAYLLASSADLHQYCGVAGIGQSIWKMAKVFLPEDDEIEIGWPCEEYCISLAFPCIENTADVLVRCNSVGLIE